MRSFKTALAATCPIVMWISHVSVAAGEIGESVEARLIPIRTTVEEGTVMMTARVRLINRLDTPVSNVQAVASHSDTIQVTPDTVTVDYIPARTGVLAEVTVTVMSPEPEQDKVEAVDALEWNVEYVVAGAEGIGESASSEAGVASLAYTDERWNSRKVRQGSAPEKRTGSRALVIIEGTVLSHPYDVRVEPDQVMIGDWVYASTPPVLTKSEKTPYLHLAANTLRRALRRGDIVLLGRGYEVILTGSRKDAFLRGLRGHRAMDSKRDAVDLLLDSTGGLHVQRIRDDMIARLDFDRARSVSTTVVRPADEGVRVPVSPGADDWEPEQTESPTGGVASDGPLVKLETPGSRDCVILRPYAWDFEGWFGETTPNKVASVANSHGYNVFSLRDELVTLHVVREKLASGCGVFYISTHGSNYSLSVEPFRFDDYSDRAPTQATTVTNLILPGATTISVESTGGFPASGDGYLVEKLIHAIKDKFTYTGKTATSFTGVSGVQSLHTPWDEEVWSDTAKDLAEAAARARRAELEAGPVFQPGDLSLGSNKSGGGCWAVGMRPRLVERVGDFADALVYADACSSAGGPIQTPLTNHLGPTSTVVEVESTAMFPQSGSAFVGIGALKDEFQYTGKTALSFTGVTGLNFIHAPWLWEQVWITGNPDHTRFDEAFLGKGARNYLGWDFSVPGFGLWWTNANQVGNAFWDALHDHYNITEAHDSVSDHLIHIQDNTPDDGRMVLYHEGEVSEVTVPDESQALFVGDTATFELAVENTGRYGDVYEIQVEIDSHGLPACLAAWVGESGIALNDGGMESPISVAWPLDDSHGIAEPGRFDVFFNLWPNDPNYDVDSVIHRLGPYTYNVVERRLDLVLAIDNTGSMWDDIAAAKSAASLIVDSVLTSADARVALVTYKDFPVWPYGGAGDYTYRDVVAFTNDAPTLISGINSMSASGGADWQESVYSALMHCIDATSLGGWRGEPIKKAIVLMGDAPPHDPEPFTGYTMAQVVQAAEDADPVIVFPIGIGGHPVTHAYFSALAEGTGGAFFTAANAGEVVDAILEAIEVITLSPFADAGGPYEGRVGEAVILDASGSYDPDGTIVLYEWDWDSDGVWDESTLGPTITHTWLGAFDGTVRMRVTDDSSLTSFDTAAVSIVANSPPDCRADGPYDVDEGDTVQLDGSGSSDLEQPSDTLTYEWDLDEDGIFGETGPDAERGDEVGMYPVYSAVGVDGPSAHPVCLRVTDDGGLTDECCTNVTVGNVAPSVPQPFIIPESVQYSDPVEDCRISASDVAVDDLEASTFWSVNGGVGTPGLPNGLMFVDDGCTIEEGMKTCRWRIVGHAGIPEGTYAIDVTVTDDDGGSTDAETTINVFPEDATVEFDAGNPVAFQVDSPGGDSGEFEWYVDVRETVPDLSEVQPPAPGDIGLAVVSMTLVPVGPGGPSSGTCAPFGVIGTGYDAVLTVRCTFDDVPVNTYSAEVTVDGGYYAGFSEDVLVVFDPSLGFTTGGGWFYWPGTEDRTNFGYTMKYNRRRTNVQGSLLMIRHAAGGSNYRIKSNAVYGLAIGEEGGGDPFGWASFNGKCTYKEPDWLEALGNYEFVVYVEDRNEPGAGHDRFWVQTLDRDGEVEPDLSISEQATDNAMLIEGGNIVVPHERH